jgi:hypothetical protein
MRERPVDYIRGRTGQRGAAGSHTIVSVLRIGVSVRLSIAVFVRVAEAGSLSAAAVAMSVPKSTVSRAITRLEESMGVSLVHRAAREPLRFRLGPMRTIGKRSARFDVAVRAGASFASS